MGALDGKLVVINGGGKEKSVGYAVARAFAKEGAHLFICGVNKRKLKATCELEGEFGIQVETHAMNSLESEEIEPAVSRAIDAFGRIDVLVNCLQHVKTGDLLERTCDEDFSLTLDNVAGTCFRWMRACHPYLKEAQGTVINFYSSASLTGTEGMASLAAASGAVQGISKVAASEWEKDGIRVETLGAFVRTSQVDRMAKQFPEDYAALVADGLLDDLADAEDIGAECIALVR